MALGTARGFGVTFRQIFQKPITQQYPEFKRPVYPRFRGRHRLWRHENGLEKCVGCSLSALAVTLFLGGWHFPVLEGLGPLWFVLKLLVLLFVFIWMRTTLPRLRYDQLMRFGWKVLLPVATINAVVTAVLVVWL